MYVKYTNSVNERPAYIKISYLKLLQRSLSRLRVTTPTDLDTEVLHDVDRVPALNGLSIIPFILPMSEGSETFL